MVRKKARERELKLVIVSDKVEKRQKAKRENDKD